MNRNLITALIVSLVFFLLGLLTLSHYGISWDEPTHFKRGQAYLWFFQTGKLTYQGLIPYDLNRARVDKNYHARSIYQDEAQNGQFWIDIDGGHPPLNGILAALTNQIFYQKLGWVGDVESYHLFEIFVTSILVGTVFLFGAETFGTWAGLIASILVASYPLLWAESHFNIKDPVETTFFTLAVYLFWKSLNEQRVRFLVLSSISAGIAFATKFNILFLSIILVPWLLSLFLFNRKTVLNVLSNKKFIISVLAFPIVMYSIFFVSWPFIWRNPTHNTVAIFRYYQDIGLNGDFQPGLKNNQWNIYPIKWILFTTPPLIFILLLLGLTDRRRYTQEKNALILWVSWLFITVFRVVIPGTTIYGGDRQIMEFIPAMCLIAGLGFEKIRLLFSRSKMTWVLFGVVLILSIWPDYKLHPNENVYFNFLSGGLEKQVDDGFSAAGNSFGNAYLQGLKWINENAPPNSKLALIQGTAVNIPTSWVRPGIDYSNNSWSGIDRQGEYLTEVTYNMEVRVYNYAWEYVDQMLVPVYQVVVDGSPILKVWKNDLAHTKPAYLKQEVVYSGSSHIKIQSDELQIDLPETVLLSRLEIKSGQANCKKVGGSIEVSAGDGWVEKKDPVGFIQSSAVLPLKDGLLTYFFAGDAAKSIKLKTDPNACILSNPRVQLKILK